MESAGEPVQRLKNIKRSAPIAAKDQEPADESPKQRLAGETFQSHPSGADIHRNVFIPGLRDMVKQKSYCDCFNRYCDCHVIHNQWIRSFSLKKKENHDDATHPHS